MVASFAIDVLKLFGLFKDEPTALERLVKERFDELERHVHAIAQPIHTQDLRNGRIAVENFSSAVKNYVNQLMNTNPSITQLENDRNLLLAQHASHIDGIAKLLDQQTWMSVFDRDEHTRVWPYMAYNLFTLPGGPGAAPQPAVLPPDGSLHFDHRLMVPLSSYAAETYLACIRGISPEYRTTGDFRANLRNYARKIDDLAQAMRQHVLARTIYDPADFAWPVVLQSHELDFSGIFTGGAAPKISGRCSRWPVGSLDLRYHDDGFFRAFLDGLWKSDLYGWPHPTKHGGMDFRWIPPAKLEPSGFGNYRITNPEECAKAANAQSEKDFADLLSVSGYSEILQLAALFRHESTAPDRSQTVQGHKPNLYRDPLPSSNVTIESEPIFMTGIVSSAATREPQNCMAKVTIWTQPIKRARPVEYQLKLRTLGSMSGTKKRWREPSYNNFQWAQYEADLSNPGFLRLELHQSNLALDDHPLLPEWSSSPRDETKHAEGVAELDAHTFDWWIPVKPPFSIGVDFKTTLIELRARGWNGERLVPKGGAALNGPRRLERDQGSMQLMSHNTLGATEFYQANFLDFIPELYWKEGGQDWDGEHREVKEETIKITYEVDWEGDRLYVTLWNDPEDRNYVVYLVVEEKMPGSGQVLHTAVPVPMNGLLTYVPQKFFDDERKAYEQAERTIGHFNEKYSERQEAGPLDPIVGWLRPGDLASSEGIERFVRLAEEHEPELLHQVMTLSKREVPTAE